MKEGGRVIKILPQGGFKLYTRAPSPLKSEPPKRGRKNGRAKIVDEKCRKTF